MELVAMVDDLTGVLAEHGLQPDDTLAAELTSRAAQDPPAAEPGVAVLATAGEGTGLLAGGPYEILGAWSGDGGVRVFVEQNTSPNPLAPPPYQQVAVQHPPVVVVSGPGFRVAVDPADHDLLAAEVHAARGDFSLHDRRATEAALRTAGFTPDPAKAGEFIRGALRLGPLLLLMLPGLILGRLLGLIWFLPGIVTNNTKKAMLDAWYSATAIGAPATHYFGLSTTTPNEDGTGVTEPSGNGYARVGKTNNSTEFPLSTAANQTDKTNGTVITFPAATGAGWGTVTYAVELNHVSNAASSTTMTDWQALTASQAISGGTTASIAAGAWTSSLT